MPILRVGLPKKTKAIKTPIKMLQNVSQRSEFPNHAATPPKPTMAAVEINVAP